MEHSLAAATRPSRRAARKAFAAIVKSVWQKVQADNCVDMAAQVSFYFVLSLFPFFLVLAAILSWMPSTTLWESFVQWIMAYFPRFSRNMIFAAIVDLTRGNTGFLSIGLVTTIWSASSGFVSLMEALTVAYGGRDHRSFWEKRLIAVSATVGAAVFFILFFGLWTAGQWALSEVSPHSGSVLLGLARRKGIWWIVTILLVCIGIDLANYFLPAMKRRWHWLSTGTIFVTLSFIVTSTSFNFYVRHSPMISRVYGTLAGFIILMMWIYLAVLILLIGAETDTAIDEWRHPIAGGLRNDRG
jgi:membrane protein